MRRELSRVTLPISWAPTPYCRAVARRAASFAGETETVARAPDSPKRAYSAEADSGRGMGAPKEEKAGDCLANAAKQDSARPTATPPSLRSWADSMVPAAARATRQSISHFSAA